MAASLLETVRFGSSLQLTKQQCSPQCSYPRPSFSPNGKKHMVSVPKSDLFGNRSILMQSTNSHTQCTKHRAVQGARASQAAAMQRSAEADVMGLLLRQRIIFLGYELNDYVADAIVSQLLLLDAQDPKKDIRLFINSPGGSISSAMGIFDAIQLCRADVSTIAFGLSASTATIVLAGGTKGKRFAMPNARIMLHQPLGGASGQAIDVEIQAKEIMNHKTNITRILSEITGNPTQQIEKDIDRDRYMSPAEAVDYGLLDGVIDEHTILPLQPIPPKSRRPELAEAEKDPIKFLTPVISDDEIV